MSNKIKKARETLAKAFKDDPGFRHSYEANIACLLHDNNTRGLSWVECNLLADKVLELVIEK